nr:MAG TPA: protein of unknown function (DUF4462) [Caudoviricetes sp.]
MLCQQFRLSKCVWGWLPPSRYGLVGVTLRRVTVAIGL